ncbi:uncharacterized protein LOC129589700 [Paramacrobiotus metropolitanus]|uniref:uncharacterized protein LOC129589700 n=1 Tax=Paramacrobiotus metropolitanus TaxID=2943436 RepID=UPI002445E055|nr:uncharacterized protein LOC129589700 [Paramacrobiotus metropolitanus]
MRQRLLYIVASLAAIFSIDLGCVSALKCYVRSPVFPLGDPQDQQQLIDCPDDFDVACMKAITIGNGETRIAKTCLSWPGEMKCAEDTVGGMYMATCYCNTDSCNAAKRSVPSIIVGYALAVFAGRCFLSVM